MSGKWELSDRQAVLEQLEMRRLLSQVGITSFGAVANDGRDDRAAIQAAVNASGPGDIVFFPGGSYDLSDEIILKGDRTYRGENGTLLKGDPSHHLFHISQDSTRIENFTLDGKPFMIDTRNNAMVAGLVINNNTLRVHARDHNANAITFTTGLRNSSITNNSFDPIDADNGIYGYYWDGLTIANNEFVNGPEGIHVVDHSNNSHDLLIEQNYFSGIRRMGLEYQGGGFNTIVQDNWYEQPSLTANFNENNDTFAYSIIATESDGTIARRNVIVAPERPDGVGCRIGFEIGGTNALIEDNYVSGVNHIVAANGFPGKTSVLCRNNFYENILQGPVGAGLTQYNNGSGVKLTWSLDRGKPGRNRRFGQTNAAPAPIPVPAPAPAPPPAPTAPSPTIPSTPAPFVGPLASTWIAPAAVQTRTTAKFVYLTDLTWASARTSWGAVRRDLANGLGKDRPGGLLRINGKSYRRGLAVAGNSQVVYNLNGRYSRFFSDIGIDDRVGSRGSMTFQVWADGKRVFNSGTLTGADKAKGVTLRVAGVKVLKLITTEAGDEGHRDRGNWAAPRLVSALPKTAGDTDKGTS